MLPKRKRQTRPPSALPKDFLHSVGGLFGKQFKAKLSGSTFLVYGELYPSETILCISMTHPKSLRAASLHISADPPAEGADRATKVTEQLQKMVDIAASWFAQCFENGTGLEAVLDAMQDMDPKWQEFDWEGAKFFVKLNRDNHALENKASEILSQAGFDPEDDEVEGEGGGGERGPLQ